MATQHGVPIQIQAPEELPDLAVHPVAFSQTVLNLLTLGINSIVASTSENKDATTWIVFFTFVSLLIVVNFVVEIGLLKGKQTRIKLIGGLIKMYKDQGVEGYYDESLLSDYSTRYNLFLLAVIFTGLIAIIVPLVLIT